MSEASKEKALVPTSGEGRQRVLKALQNSVFVGVNPESVEMALSYCEVRGLDPFMGHVHVVPMRAQVPDANDRTKKHWQDVDRIMPGIDQYRFKAATSGKLAGISEPEYGPVVEESWQDEEWVDGENGKRRKITKDTKVSFPQWCKVIVYRVVEGLKGPAAFTGEVRWLEEYAAKKSGAPNSMWAKRPYGQLAKCAEAQALRRAFPEHSSGPTAEETYGKVIDAEFEEDRPTVRTPQARSAKSEPDKAPKKSSNDHEDKIGQGVQNIMSKIAKRKGISEEAFLERAGVESLGDVTMAQADELTKWLQGQPDVEA